jgi:thiol:disulfide interchange protein DsbD
VASLVIFLAAYFYVLEGQLNWRSPSLVAKAGHGGRNDPHGIQWQSWNANAVEAARAAGRPVLVDFTADWCLTCQVNKKTSLEIPSVRSRLKEINALALLGDHTNEDPAITEELKKYDRAGVPLVLVYPADRNLPPIVLPEVLTPKIVLEALDKAAGTPAKTSRAGGDEGRNERL